MRVTNVPIETEKAAWEIVFAYRARWKIETCFRYGKSELCLETVNLRDQEKREKMLLIVMVVYMLLLWMMEEAQKRIVRWLLYNYCHRTVFIVCGGLSAAIGKNTHQAFLL